MAETPEKLRISALSPRQPNPFTLTPGAQDAAQIAQALGLTDLRKLRFAGEVTSQGARDWRLTATLGATVVQPCVATLAPVTTRIDRAVTRVYLAAGITTPEGDEVEMPEDETQEPLPEAIDLMALLHEELALAVPDYPRADDAAPVRAAIAPDGVAPLTDDDTRPFAGLAGLRDRLGDAEDDS